MINTKEDAQKLVAYTHYAPKGTRSFGPVRALLYGGADYPKHANDTIVTFAMIETAAALDNLDAILSVEGLDAIYIGPSDLSLALGCNPTFDDLDPKAAEAVDHILARAKAHGVVAGIHNGTPESAQKRIAKGFQFVTVSSDARLMAAGAQQVISKMRASKTATSSGSYSFNKGSFHENRFYRTRHHGFTHGSTFVGSQARDVHSHTQQSTSRIGQRPCVHHQR
jgi:4-hydroxy-2-oxoheptanedioate aldolase